MSDAVSDGARRDAALNVDWRLVGVGAMLFGLFLAEAIAMREGLFRALDHRLLAWLRHADKSHSFAGSTLQLKVLVGLTNLGGGPVRAPVTIAAALVLGLRHRGREAAMLAFGVAGAAIALPVLKVLFDRPRPDLIWHLVVQGDWSFPSGHAMGSMVLYPLLGFIAGTTRGWPRASLLAAIGMLLALLIGLSRVLLGVHWASDVIGGWLIGAAILSATFGIFRKPLVSFG